MEALAYEHESPQEAALRAAATVVRKITEPRVGWRDLIPGMHVKVAGEWQLVVTKHYAQRRVLLDPQGEGQPWWRIVGTDESFPLRDAF